MPTQEVVRTPVGYKTLTLPDVEPTDLCLTQFLVGPSAAGAPFQNIQAAYDAAKAAGAPAQVLVCPGTYVENLSLDTPGVDIIAVAQNSQQPGAIGGGDGQTVLDGQIIVDLVSAVTRDATTMRWQGIDVRPASGSALLIAGPNNAASYLYFTDCQIVSIDNDAVSIANTGADGFDPTTLDCQRCNIQTLNVGGAAVQLAGAAFPAQPFILAEGCSIQALGGNGIEAMGAGVGLDDCLVTAGLRGLEAVGAAVRSDETVWSIGAPGPVLDLDAGSFARLIDNAFTADADAPFIVGAGLCLHDTMTFLTGKVPPWDTALTVVTEQAVPQEAEIVTVILPDTGAYTLTSETNVLGECSGVAGAATIFLPAPGSRPGPLRLKLGAGNVGTVTIDGNGAPIRLAGVAPAAATPLTDPGFVLVWDPTTSTWEGWT